MRANSVLFVLTLSAQVSAQAAEATPPPTTAPSDESGEPAPEPAQPSNLPPPPPPKGAAHTAKPVIVVETPAPPPAVPRAGVRVHDGFYLRLGAGFGGGAVRVSSDQSAVLDYSLSGGSGALDLWIGGTPSPGLALGAALTGTNVNTREAEIDDEATDTDGMASLGSLGFFIDGYPNPRAGFHFGGQLGLTSFHAETSGGTQDLNGGGVSMATWVGYEWWVGPQWSLGGMLRLFGAFARDEQDDLALQGSFGNLTLMFTALYH